MKLTGKYTKQYIVAYIYILPFLILFLVFNAFPILQSLFLSFTSSISVGEYRFVGLNNFIKLFNDNLFWKSLWNTVFIWIFAHALILPGGFILAYLLTNVVRKGSNLFKTIFFTPMITSSVAIALVFLTLFGKHYGLLNFLLNLAGQQSIDWLGGSGSYIKPMVIIVFAWKWIGYNMVIYSAGMQGIDKELYEYAYVEGASKFTVLLKITIPLMKPIILFTLVMSFIGGLQIFDEPYIFLQRLDDIGAGPNYEGLVLARYIYYLAFKRWKFGYASSLAYVLVFIIVILSAVSNKFFSKEKKKRK